MTYPPENRKGSGLGKSPGSRATQFKPGQSGNPGGAPSLPPEVKEARRLNQKELELSLNRWLFATQADMERAADDPSTAMIDRVVISLLQAATKNGCPTRLELLMNRLVGKVMDRIEVKPAQPFIINKSDGTKVVMGVEQKADED
jgi:hypothetical protein